MTGQDEDEFEQARVKINHCENCTPRQRSLKKEYAPHSPLNHHTGVGHDQLQIRVLYPLRAHQRMISHEEIVIDELEDIAPIFSPLRVRGSDMVQCGRPPAPARTSRVECASKMDDASDGMDNVNVPVWSYTVYDRPSNTFRIVVSGDFESGALPPVRWPYCVASGRNRFRDAFVHVKPGKDIYFLGSVGLARDISPSLEPSIAFNDPIVFPAECRNFVAWTHAFRDKCPRPC
jgi:hypothetical protein